MRRLSSHAGFTLIEIMVVVLILGLLAALVVPKVIGRTDEARVTKAKADIKAIESAFNLFKIDNGFYPTAAEGINALIQAPPRAKRWNPDGYLDKVPVDPWQNEYVYLFDGRQIVIASMGADGVEGGDGYNADISNLNIE